jgi:hypothetical protein
MPQSGWSAAPVSLNTVYDAMKYQRPIKITATHTVLTVSTTTMLGPRSPPRASFAVSMIRPWAVCSGIGTSRFSGDIILTRAGGGRFPLRKAEHRRRRCHDDLRNRFHIKFASVTEHRGKHFGCFLCLPEAMHSIAECRKLAEALRERANAIVDAGLKAEYGYLVRGFLRLARQYEQDIDYAKATLRRKDRTAA